ncbi:MAG: epimerase, partial [Acidobacteriota bacterium]|nr:epimerase [Acidobacteriota bacterium]
DGDIRHGMADLSRVASLLGYQPQWKFRDGLHRFLEWANESEASTEAYDRSIAEMQARGLLHARR